MFSGYQNRMSRKRATDKIKDVLPSTPQKKVEVIEEIMTSSPRTRKLLSDRKIVKTPEDERQAKTLQALANDIAEGLQEIKGWGSNENRSVFGAFKSLAFGKHVQNAKAAKSLSKIIKLNEKSIGKAIKKR